METDAAALYSQLGRDRLQVQEADNRGFCSRAGLFLAFSSGLLVASIGVASKFTLGFYEYTFLAVTAAAFLASVLSSILIFRPAKWRNGPSLEKAKQYLETHPTHTVSDWINGMYQYCTMKNQEALNRKTRLLKISASCMGLGVISFVSFAVASFIP